MNWGFENFKPRGIRIRFQGACSNQSLTSSLNVLLRRHLQEKREYGSPCIHCMRFIFFSVLALLILEAINPAFSETFAPDPWLFPFRAGQAAEVRVNLLPAIQFIRPGFLSQHLASKPLILEVEASDPDGEIREVQFYQEQIHLGTVTAPPFLLAVPDLAPGAHRFRAVAIDDLGQSSFSFAQTDLVGFQAGSADQEFASAGCNLPIHALVVQEDGKILLGGRFTTYQQYTRRHLARVLPNGDLDFSFNPGQGTGGWVWSLALQPDGKILVGGQFTVYQSHPVNGIARLLPDGAFDHSFDPGRGTMGIVQKIALQRDGKILIAGPFQEFNGKTRGGIARLHPDGTLDESFTAGALQGPVLDLLLQEDEKIWIGGAFGSVNGISRRGIARLHPDGTLDTEMAAQIEGNVLALALQHDGKVLLGGAFTTVDGVARRNLARLHPDGAIDMDFEVGTGPDGAIIALRQQSDGRILAAGTFPRFNGLNFNGVVRLKETGDLDPEFITLWQLRPAQSVWAAALDESNNSLYLGGDFAQFDTSQSRNFVRIRLDSETPKIRLRRWTNPANPVAFVFHMFAGEIYRFEATSSLTHIDWMVVERFEGGPGGKLRIVTDSLEPESQKFYRLVMEQEQN
jgi:uncharacterized delta-60 repeat protein